MLTHAHRHLPYTQRPHTRCLPHTRPLTHSCRFPRTHHTIHTRGALTRGVSFTHRASLPHGRSHTRAVSGAHVVPLTRGFIHTDRFTHTHGLFHTRCPFLTRRAGKHALRHTRHHPTRTRGLTHGRTRGLSYTWDRQFLKQLEHGNQLTNENLVT